MKVRLFPLVLTAGFLFFLSGGLCHCVAQDSQYSLGHNEVLGKLKRPPVSFPHDTHTNALQVEGCGACHHAQDEETGQLEYVEGEETSCTECHGAKKGDGKPSLMNAYHGTCVSCHRDMARAGKKTGPATCGECHKRDK